MLNSSPINSYALGAAQTFVAPSAPQATTAVSSVPNASPINSYAIAGKRVIGNVARVSADVMLDAAAADFTQSQVIIEASSVVAGGGELISSTAYSFSVSAFGAAEVQTNTFYNPQAQTLSTALVTGAALLVTENDVVAGAYASSGVQNTIIAARTLAAVIDLVVDGTRYRSASMSDQAAIQGLNSVARSESAVDSLTVEDSLILQSLGEAWLRARCVADVITGRLVTSREMLQALADAPALSAYTSEIAAIATYADNYSLSTATQALDTLAASIIPQFTLQIHVSEALEGLAADAADLSAYLTASVLSEAAANTIFKLNDDLVAGWVMNLEGDKPFSRYENYSFNSFAKIGGQYYAASDDGLYTLAGDTDVGSEITASLTSMMLDFDTSAHKRVVAAYLGYTASKQLILKVRSVDQGQLVEHWYEARDQLANAPRENYMQLGRGLKSRYWQFELVNVDGGDFEVDSLELWPLVLNRRV